MDELYLETYEDNHSDLERYLSDSIISYGIEQLNGSKPKNLYCCYRNPKGGIVGGIMGVKTINLFFISHLFVEPEYRNNGLGRRLLTEIEKVARQQGCDTLRLNTFNKKSQQLYLNAGFMETVCINDYMNGFDLVYYHKHIN